MWHYLTQISLVSLSLNENSRKSCNIKQQYSATLPCINSYANSLWTIYKIISLNNREKKRIVYVLQNYLGKHKYCQKNNKLIVSKYIYRFSYKYQKSYKNWLIDQGRKKKEINKSNKLSIISLYLLYKILKTNNKFAAYKRLMNKSVSHKPLSVK